MNQNDPEPEQVFEGDIFAQTSAILQWRALDQTLFYGKFIIKRFYLQTCNSHIFNLLSFSYIHNHLIATS